MAEAVTVEKVSATLRRFNIAARVRAYADDPSKAEILCPDRDTQDAAATLLVNRFDVRWGTSTATVHTLICSTQAERGNPDAD
jgi:hypothetical protein